MARPIRINVAGGWYHVISRGTERRVIYEENPEYAHFLDLLGEMCGRFRLRIHAYVLMPNHYHLLIETPEANLSPAMQWLKTSYGMWYNRRHGRVGPLFQGRFKAGLVESPNSQVRGGWAMEVSRYIHLNPVRVKGLGLGKQEAKGEGRGRSRAPTAEVAARRIDVLRGYRWSSYPAYAGYRKAEDWLTTRDLLGRMKQEGKMARAKYRRAVEGVLRQGVEVGGWGEIREALVLGTEAFRRAISGEVKRDRLVQKRAREISGFVGAGQVVMAVEKLLGEPWAAFRDRQGDWGRDMVLYLLRRHSGMTLREVGAWAGGMTWSAVSVAIRRLGQRMKADAKLSSICKTLQYKLSNIQT